MHKMPHTAAKTAKKPHIMRDIVIYISLKNKNKGAAKQNAAQKAAQNITAARLFSCRAAASLTYKNHFTGMPQGWRGTSPASASPLIAAYSL